MKKAFIAPSRYIQGEGELSNLAQYVEPFGVSKALIVSSEEDFARVKEAVDNSFNRSSLTYTSGGFNRECCEAEINRLTEIAKAENCDVVVGIGGGKSLDTATTVASNIKGPVVCAATIASTDAPCSSSAVIYTEDGQFSHYIQFPKNPDIVLIDTRVVAGAPVRLLVAGMGDALSTYFEARACERSNADNNAASKSSKAAQALAKLCFETLLEDSVKAKESCEAKVVTPALENIIEANTLLSGIGFESGGLAAAHAVHNGLTALEETHSYFHGEKVAFGTVTQLILENAPSEELELVLDYCDSVGLPVCLRDLGVTSLSDDQLMKVAQLATAPEETIHNMPFKVTAELVYAAILTADRIGAKSKGLEPVELKRVNRESVSH